MPDKDTSPPPLALDVEELEPLDAPTTDGASYWSGFATGFATVGGGLALGAGASYAYNNWT
ncbi:hypothetical protein AB0A74_16145 [Saccharothrix sp. NPDC042600]|uniref:hypothetical protein n=1 Tax=Saccharothrix TaxID=2071 RepID=UPI0033E8269E|nr:hypothetical protein GCM10017745_45480 [Saccharothrix mutabilis subsp. capreolus]